MIIENIKETGPERFLDYNQLSVGKGEGTQEDPFLIGPSELLPKHLRIKNAAYYVHFKNCDFETLILKKCSNMEYLISGFSSLTGFDNKLHRL
ncbi:MAG: hypothetical protein ACFFCL_15860 [Promethearchaeota archaeon]